MTQRPDKLSNPPAPILVTIDVEDWFQVENLRSVYPTDAWDGCDLRVRANTEILLALLDLHQVQATFFVLGWIAERCPELVKDIQTRGHEIASHGYGHNMCSNMSRLDLKEDLYRAKAVLGDITGRAVCGYRAPSFSLTDPLIELLPELGYEYDSSYNNLAIDRRHGKLNGGWSRSKRGYPIHENGIAELPISNLMVGPVVLPWGGGGYFRFWPVPMFLRGVARVLRTEGRYVFYIHPWELDSRQPRVQGLSKLSRVRHYLNLHDTFRRANRFLSKFQASGFVSCSRYLHGDLSQGAAGSNVLPLLARG